MTARCLIDTNVFVYARDRSEPTKQAVAIEVTGLLAESGSARVSTQVVCEFYNAVTLRPHLRVPRAEAALLSRALLLSFETLLITPEIAGDALGMAAEQGLGVWDAQLLATAAHYGMRHVLSEDFEHRRVYGEVTVLDPFATDFDPAELAS